MAAFGRAVICASAMWLAFMMPALSETIRITIDKLAFQPASVSARVGDTIEWVNDDILAHTATASNGDWNVLLTPKKSGWTMLKSVGTINYYCKFHPNMAGRIVVER